MTTNEVSCSPKGLNRTKEVILGRKKMVTAAFLVTLFLALPSAAVFAQSNFWAKSYALSSHSEAFDVRATPDGGSVVAGARSSALGYPEAWVVKLDGGGTVIWQKSFGNTERRYMAWSVDLTNDGGYIVAGSASNASDNDDVWVSKLDASGTILWQRTYGGNGADEAYDVHQTSDGGYIVAGKTESFRAGPDATDFWVLKLTSAGRIDWHRAYGGDTIDVANAVQQTPDGGYIVAGRTLSFSAQGATDVWVIKLNSRGAIQWEKTYGGSSIDGHYGVSIQTTFDGGYIFAADSASFTPPLGLNDSASSFLWVVKLNPDGTTSWQNTYSWSETYPTSRYPYYSTHYSSGNPRSIKQSSDGGYIVAAQGQWLVKLNSNGTVAWQYSYGGTGYQDFPSVEQMGDGGYLVSGSSNSFSSGTGRFDVWVFKTTDTGTIVFNSSSGARTSPTPAVAAATSAFGLDTQASMLIKRVTSSIGRAVTTDTYAVVQQQAP